MQLDDFNRAVTAVLPHCGGYLPIFFVQTTRLLSLKAFG
jgi:hypothetical protein